MNTSTTARYDAIIIGTGQGGKPLAFALAGAGWKLAVIEKEHVGGSCINVGCTPTKTMVASARVAYLAKRAADYGVQTGPVQVDMRRVRQRKQQMVETFRKGGQRALEKNENIDLIFGQARFVNANTVEVHLKEGSLRRLEAPRIFINTGARPVVPELPGLAKVPYLNSTSIMELEAVPKHLIILGGGYIGLEFGQMFRRFGSRVSIIQRSGQLLTREDRDVAEEVAKILTEDGIDVYLNARAESVATEPSGKIVLNILLPEETITLTGSHLLIAVGRQPNSDMLNLPAAGIATDKRGFIQVNDKLETGVPGIYAIGDVKGGPAFTHISYDDFRVLRANLLEGKNLTIQNRLVPYTVFIDPQLGRVGMNEKEAQKQNISYRVAHLPMTHVARALEMDETRGFMKAIVDAQSGQILGAAILGVEGGEIMSVLQTAMMGKLHYSVIKEAIYAHPLLSESLNNLFMAMDRA